MSATEPEQPDGGAVSPSANGRAGHRPTAGRSVSDAPGSASATSAHTQGGDELPLGWIAGSIGVVAVVITIGLFLPMAAMRVLLPVMAVVLPVAAGFVIGRLRQRLAAAEAVVAQQQREIADLRGDHRDGHAPG